MPKWFEGLTIRPEIRFDKALNGTKPYNNGRDSWAVAPAVDVTFPF
jgi:hypothetical protein